MRLQDVQYIFQKGQLRIGDDYYWLDGKGNYVLAKGDNSIHGTYDFISRKGKIYLQTNPPILQDKNELEVTICLDSYPVTFEQG